VTNRSRPRLILAVIFPVAVGMAGALLRAQSSQKMAFEVASVKAAKGGRPPNFPLDIGDAKTPGGRLSGTLPLLLCVAFASKIMPSEVSAQLPKSFPEAFDIEARAPGLRVGV
jgi:hypothetical protein